MKDRRKMFDIDAGIERSCGLGTVFDKKICNCVHSNEPFKKSKLRSVITLDAN